MKRVYEFGPFRLDERERALFCDGAPVRLTPKTFDVLRVLLESGNCLVEKDRLFRSVWGGVHVDEGVLTRAISDLRKALGQNGDQSWIETVPKFGYRFSSEVRVVDQEVEVPQRRRSPLWLQAAAVVVCAGLSALVIGWIGDTPSENIHTLVVLPFQATSAPAEGAEGAALGVGLADALITRLGNLDGLIVRPLSTVRRFEGQAVDPVQAARDLRADAALEGLMQFSGGAVRISVRLFRARDGKTLWAGQVESSAGRLFELEDALAEQVAGRLVLRLSENNRRDLASRRNYKAAAHRAYMEGRYEWGRRSREGFEKAAQYFEQGIAIDPAYGRAYAGLADCYLMLGAYGFAPQLEMLPKAKVLALRALELEPGLAEAHATLGLITQNLDWDWDEVERQYREAIRLAPGYATAHHWYAEFLSIRGRFDDSRSEFARAREIDPISPIIRTDEAQLYFFERHYEQSLALLEQVAREAPSFALARERIAFTYLMQGREEDAWREAMSLPECVSEGSPCRRMWTAWLPRRDPRAAREALDRLEADASAGRVPAYAVMLGHIRQADTDRALYWLERMLDTHGVWLITAKVNPLFDPLRSQPRAAAVLAKLHLT